MTYLLQDAAGCAETRRYARWFADRPEAMWLLRKAHNERMPTMTTLDIAKDLRAILATLNRANESGVITDTIWHGPAETLWDMVEHTIAAAEAQADELERLRAQVAQRSGLDELRDMLRAEVDRLNAGKVAPAVTVADILAEFDRRAAPGTGFYEPEEPAQIIRAMLAASPAAPAQQAAQAERVAPLQWESAEEARKDRAHAEDYYRQAERLLTASERTLHDEISRLRAQVASLSREAWTWSKALEAVTSAAQAHDLADSVCAACQGTGTVTDAEGADWECPQKCASHPPAQGLERQAEPVATRWHDKWRVVPVAPTTGMLIAGNHCQPGDYSAALVWSSMLEAAERSTELSYTRPLPQDMRAQAPAAEPLTKKRLKAVLQELAESIDSYNIVMTHWPEVARAIERAHGIGMAAAPVTLTDDARDAARYRWLREENQKVAGPAAYAPWGGEIMFGAELDAALDKAMAAAKEQQ